MKRTPANPEFDLPWEDSPEARALTARHAEGMSLVSVARYAGLSRQRIEQIEKRALRRLAREHPVWLRDRLRILQQKREHWTEEADGSPKTGLSWRRVQEAYARTVPARIRRFGRDCRAERGRLSNAEREAE
ncbi:MAG: hypothetical protein GWN58_58585 [Anaerolineae bacterium]|nr:hypothetical protein [Anaerolineae bacterium]